MKPRYFKVLSITLICLYIFLLSACNNESVGHEYITEARDYDESHILREELIEQAREGVQQTLDDSVNQRIESAIERQAFLLSIDLPDNDIYFEYEDVHVFFPPWVEGFMLSAPLSEEHLEALLSHEQRRNHADIIAKKMSEYFGVEVATDEIGLHVSGWTFSWADFVGAERFEIVLDYLGVGSNMFFDGIIHNYPWTVEPFGILRDVTASLTREAQLGVPSEFDVYDPQRIMVEMLRGFNDFALEIRSLPR